jgi:hypothetical protein
MVVGCKIRSVSDPSTTLRVVLSGKSKDDGSAWGWGPMHSAKLKQQGAGNKIRSASDGSAWGWGPMQSAKLKQQGAGNKIRSVSDGSAWGWGPMRTK